MRRFDSPLTNLKIASPCSANWDEMYGDDRMRFCGECKLSVYNLSGMTKYDAENLLTNSEGRLCVRYYKRADGTIITSDCPVGWARVKQRVSVIAAAVFSLLISLAGGLIFTSYFNRKATIGSIAIPAASPTPQPLMGAVAVKPESDYRSTDPQKNQENIIRNN
jgi:hypothetical protein